MTAVVAKPESRTAPAPGLTPRRVLRSEWIKLRSLRSTWFCLGTMSALIVGLGYLLSLKAYGDAVQFGPVDHHYFDPVQVSLQGVFPAQLAVGVLGALFVTGEYGTGMIRASLTVVPRRIPVLAAKVAALAAVTFTLAFVMSLIAFLLGQQVLAAHHLGVSLADPGAARAVTLGALELTCIALLGAGCGFVLRHGAAAITAPLVLLVVLPMLAGTLPDSVRNHVERYLPMNAIMQITRSKAVNPDALGPWAGLGVVALYALATLVIGAIVLRRRDA